MRVDGGYQPSLYRSGSRVRASVAASPNLAPLIDQAIDQYARSLCFPLNLHPLGVKFARDGRGRITARCGLNLTALATAKT